MTPRQAEISNGSDGVIMGVKASTIAFLVNKIGLPSLVVVAIIGAALWYGPTYLERQANAVDSMAESFKTISDANAAIQIAVKDIQKCTDETKAFQKTVSDEHAEAKEEHEQMLEDHRAMMQLLGAGGQ